MRDLHHNIGTDLAFETAAISTDTTTAGEIIDMKGFNALEFVIQSGVLAAGNFTPLIEESDASDMSGSNAVIDDELLGTEAGAAFAAAADDHAVKRIGYRGNKRYVRLSIVSSGTADGTISAVALKAKPSLAPTAA